MSLPAIQSVSFKGVEGSNNQRKTGGVVPTIASAVIPGFGQYIDNRGKQAKKFFLTHLATLAVSTIVGGVAALGARAAMNKGSKGAAIASLAVGTAISLGAGIKNLINYFKNLKDAYQGDKKVDTQA